MSVSEHVRKTWPEYYVPYETEGAEMLGAEVRQQLYLKSARNDSDTLMGFVWCIITHTKSTHSAVVV